MTVAVFPFVDLDHPTRLAFKWGWLLVTRANFIVFLLLVAVFVVGISVRLPGARRDIQELEPEHSPGREQDA